MRGSPPDGLERSRPREVRLRPAGRALLAAAGALGLGSAVAFAVLQVLVARGADASARLRSEGEVVEAVVTRVDARKGESQGRIAYVFPVREGGRVAGTARVPRTRAAALAPGAAIAVRYVPGQPEVNTPEGVELRRLPAPVPFAAAGLMLAGVGAALASLAHQRRLLAEGRATRGVVLARETSDHGTAYRYEFTTLAGRRQRARQATSRKLKAGDEVWVVYDPDHPRRCALYPFGLVEPRERRPLRA